MLFYERVPRALQLETHEHDLLIAALARIEAEGIAPVFHETRLFIQLDGSRVLRHRRQLQLRIARLPRALDARLRQRPAEAEPRAGC